MEDAALARLAGAFHAPLPPPPPSPQQARAHGRSFISRRSADARRARPQAASRRVLDQGIYEAYWRFLAHISYDFECGRWTRAKRRCFWCRSTFMD